ncbi:hypothetical protein DCC85_01160 [Paenibacillus sp. CAA11]|uniref:hypothetical protein n=1 Tax=Paenibacillus sp. CAA11 TaxID=1532905 RepID=UPI000D3D5170|nr:hypothetical protein [Paenibacillus sp. CAA11]AWB42973.1 hypothetical protein DCC85_01160 [Paenibacillus sp. CAA11]
MTASRDSVEQDYIIEHLKDRFGCRVLWSEGRPCLEYESEEQLSQITEYIQVKFEVELLDVFFTAVESLPIEP